MNVAWGYSFVSVGLVSAISLVGIVALWLKENTLRKILAYLVSFSAGALLGDVFLHLLPETAEEGGIFYTSTWVLVGIISFFIFERFLFWHHSHTSHDEGIHAQAYLTIFGDFLHNFIDGVAIAASFLISFELGVATTIAVILHEIPQEMGQFGILVHGGWSPQKALLYNFVSALSSVLGAILVLIFADSFEGAPTALIAFGAASFIYIALADLMPELQKEKSLRRTILQIVSLILGVVTMALLLVI